MSGFTSVPAGKVRRPGKRSARAARHGTESRGDGVLLGAAAVHESSAIYTATVAPRRTCFVCGLGPEAGKLEGSGREGDWVHLPCLKLPYNWDTAVV